MNFGFLSNLGSGAGASVGANSSMGGWASLLGNSGGDFGSGDFSSIAGSLIGQGAGNLFNKLGPENKFNKWRSGVTNTLNELYGLYNQQPQEEDNEDVPQMRPYAQTDNNNGFQMGNYARLFGYR